MKTMLTSVSISLVLLCADLDVLAGETNATAPVVIATNITATRVISTNSITNRADAFITSDSIIANVSEHLDKPLDGWGLISNWKFRSERSAVPHSHVFEEATYPLFSRGRVKIGISVRSRQPVASIGPEVGETSGGLSANITLR